MNFRQELTLLLVLLLGGTNRVLGFAELPAVSRMVSRTTQWVPSTTTTTTTCRRVKEFSFAEDFSTSAVAKDEKKGDPQLAAFKVGSVVRISKPGLKAYQVAPSGYGSYDDDKQFVPLDQQDDKVERKRKNLQVPVGLRGVVTKIYDNEDLSANFRIQVKFEPGEHTEEGYDPPVSFLFHLSDRELEVVDE